MRISDWSSDVCSSDLHGRDALAQRAAGGSGRLRGDACGVRRAPADRADRHAGGDRRSRRLSRGGDLPARPEPQYRRRLVDMKRLVLAPAALLLAAPRPALPDTVAPAGQPNLAPLGQGRAWLPEPVAED